MAAATLKTAPIPGAGAYGPCGAESLEIEPADNGLIVRVPRYGKPSSCMPPFNDVAVFTDANAFGAWMAEHFRKHVANADNARVVAK